MVTSSDDRRAARRTRATEHFGEQADAALDAFGLLDLAWHDCYKEPSPPERIAEDIWLAAGGDLASLLAAAHLAVVDFRDLRMWADALRHQ